MTARDERTPCTNCGKPGAHFVPPSLGDAGFYSCRRERTPAQVAEDEAREAHKAIRRLDTFAAKGHSREKIDGAHAAIDRALKARAWAQAEEIKRATGWGFGSELAAFMDGTCDRLRREYESSK